MKDGQGVGAALGTNPELPHCCREGRNFSFVEPTNVAASQTFARTIPSEWAELFGDQPFADHTATLSSGTSVVISCASVHERTH